MTVVALRVEGLSVMTTAGTPIVSNVDLAVLPGELVGLVGETGAGKTVTARAVLGLLPPGLRSTGIVRFAGGDPIPLERTDLLALHLGRTAGLMLQDPVRGFDPLQRIGGQLVEAVVRNRLLTKTDAVERARELCERLELEDASALFRLYPHQLSGGMAQRVALAIMLMPAPRVLLMDEPTSALDANVRVEALKLVQSFARDDGTAIVIISHDLGLVSRFCDRIAVMYAGHLVETGPTTAVLRQPAHPYTTALISCSLPHEVRPATRLRTIPGEPPLPGKWPDGCYFHPRCPEARGRCRTDRPELRMLTSERGAACHFAALEARNEGDRKVASST